MYAEMSPPDRPLYGLKVASDFRVIGERRFPRRGAHHRTGGFRR
jgi:hypothetical protein